MKTKYDFDTIINPDNVLFFDMDGTLINTDYANFLSYKKAIHLVTNNGLELSYNPKVRFNRSFLKIALLGLQQSDYEEITRKKEEYYIEFLSEIKLNEVIAEVLFKYLKTNKTVLVSNCRKDRAIITLNHFGLTDKFSNIFFREFEDNDKKINKFQNAIFKLGVPPNLIIAFENEESEIVDAKKVGISIINPIYY
ncbi:HAD hydrolase-like protein [Tannerella forsythia]|uniref:HAD family phosphatase n=1 Tax=Tannerella forsythia TaxID=28112 RepID=A0A3P1YIT3_TANFO|nr:HAD hydrolase-like protein [Tannerella forsythia]RRD70050.1 HAD family phosphatase [Tannerella forsythia]